MAVLLIVEDDTATNEAICEYMSSAGHTTLSALDGEQGLQIVREKSVDLVVLDIMLPKRTGLEVLKELRRTSNIPVLMLTALDDEPTQAASFDEQADDYITKPFSMKELIARVKANVRRHTMFAAPPTGGSDLKFGALILNREQHVAKKNGELLELSAREFDLLCYLAAEPERVFSREELMQEVWGYEYYGDLRAVDVAVRRLREKIEDDPAQPEYIVTKRGAGYYFGKIRSR